MSGLSVPAPPDLGLAGDRRTSTLQIVLALVASGVAGLALVVAPSGAVAIGLIGAAGLTAIGFLRPALFLLLFLAIRPLLDQFSRSTAGVPGANLAGAIGALLVAVTVVALVLRRREVKAPPNTGILTILLLASVAAAIEASVVLRSVAGTEPVSEVVRLMALLAVFLLASHMIASVSQVRTLFVVVGLSAVIPTIWGLFELAFGAPVKEGTDVARISGTFTGPVPFGAFLGLTSLILIFGPVKQLKPWVRWTALTAMLVALTASYSRVGWVIFVLGMVILGWRHNRRAVGAMVAAMVVLIIAIPSVRERALPVSAQSDATSTTSEAGYQSYDWRIQNWGGLLQQWSHKPVFGWGLDSVRYVNTRSPVGDEDSPGMGFDAHNMIVRVLVEGGVVLLAVYLAFFYLVIRRMRRLSKLPWELADQARLLYVLWGLVLFAGATTDDPFTLTALMVGLLALTGAVEGAFRTTRRERHQEWRAATRAPA